MTEIRDMKALWFALERCLYDGANVVSSEVRLAATSAVALSLLLSLLWSLKEDGSSGSHTLSEEDDRRTRFFFCASS